MPTSAGGARRRGSRYVDGVTARLVAVRLAPGPRFAEALDRAWERGDAVAPIDPSAPPAAVAARLEALRPHVLVDDDGATRRPDAIGVDDGTALVVGTSSAQKAAVLSHDALGSAIRASLARLGGLPTDRWLCCLPTHHVAGISVLLRARALGGEAVVHPRFDPDAVAAEGGITHVSLVPTMLARLLDARADVARYRTILLGGAAPPPGLLDRAAEAGARVVASYGMTETCGGCVYDGRPLDGYDVAVGGDRRIRVHGPLFDGYRLRDDLSRAVMEDGWLVTSDVGRWEDGRLVVEGRADDVVVSGGENVDGSAVAQVLRRHPAVADAAVLGHPDPEWGRRVVAYCVAQGTPPGDDELGTLVRDALGRAAVPKEVRWVAAIPRGTLGKVRRDVLMRDDGGTMGGTTRDRSAEDDG